MWYKCLTLSDKSTFIDLFVYVKPKAKKSAFIGIRTDNSVAEFAIAASPSDGKANEELIKFLSHFLNISNSSIILLKGFHSKFKCLRIINITESLLHQKFNQERRNDY